MMKQRKAISSKITLINQNSTHIYASSCLTPDVHCHEQTTSPPVHVKEIVYSSLWKQAPNKREKWHWWHRLLLNLTGRNKGSLSQSSLTRAWETWILPLFCHRQFPSHISSLWKWPPTKKTLPCSYSKFCTLLNINPHSQDQRRSKARLQLLGCVFYRQNYLLKSLNRICAKFSRQQWEQPQCIVT